MMQKRVFYAKQNGIHARKVYQGGHSISMSIKHKQIVGYMQRKYKHVSYDDQM